MIVGLIWITVTFIINRPCYTITKPVYVKVLQLGSRLRRFCVGPMVPNVLCCDAEDFRSRVHDWKPSLFQPWGLLHIRGCDKRAFTKIQNTCLRICATVATLIQRLPWICAISGPTTWLLSTQGSIWTSVWAKLLNSLSYCKLFSRTRAFIVKGKTMRKAWIWYE